MNKQFTPNLALFNCLQTNRSICLDYFVSRTHTRNSPLYREDILITRVRAGVFLDTLIECLLANRMEKLNQFFHETATQLSAARFSYEEIKLMYDLLEGSILEVLADTLKEQSTLNSSVRSIKSAMQLARIIAVNQHISRVATSTAGAVAPRLKPGSSPASLKQTVFPDSSSRKEHEFSQDNQAASSPPFLTYLPSYGSRNVPGSDSPKSNGAAIPDANFKPTAKDGSESQADLSSTLTGYIEWPLKPLANTSPPEYRVTLQDGMVITVLLVDNPRVYSVHIINNIRTVVCKVRRLGPLALAYP